MVKRETTPNPQPLFSSGRHTPPLLSCCCAGLKSLWPAHLGLSRWTSKTKVRTSKWVPNHCVSSSSFISQEKKVIPSLPTGHTHISSTRTWRASSSYRLCCGPSSPAAPSCRTVAAPRRWLRRTPPSGSSVSAPSTRCMSPPQFFPTAPWRLPPAQASPAASPARSGPWRPASGRTACPPGGRAWGGSGGGFRGPTSPKRFGKTPGWPHWSRAARRRCGCSRSGGVCQTRPEGEGNQ